MPRKQCVDCLRDYPHPDDPIGDAVAVRAGRALCFEHHHLVGLIEAIQLAVKDYARAHPEFIHDPRAADVIAGVGQGIASDIAEAMGLTTDPG